MVENYKKRQRVKKINYFSKKKYIKSLLKLTPTLRSNRTMLDHRHHNTTTTPPRPVFDVYNLVPDSNPQPPARQWKRIGNVTGGRVSLEAVMWVGRNHVGPPQQGQRRFRVATAFAPPFVMPATRVENQSCLLGLPCLQVRVL